MCVGPVPPGGAPRPGRRPGRRSGGRAGEGHRPIRCHRRPRPPGASRHRGPERRGRDNDPGRAPGGAPGAGRGPGRGGVREDRAGIGVYPAEPGQRRPGHGRHPALGLLRRPECLRGPPGPGQPAGAYRGQRDAPGQPEHLVERQRHRHPRHLSRPPERLFLRDQPPGRGAGRPDPGREHHQLRLEHGLGRPEPAGGGGVDHGDGDPLRVPPLRPGTGAGVGDQREPGGAGQERVHPAVAGTPLVQPERDLPAGIGRDPGGPGGSQRLPRPGVPAVRHLDPPNRPDHRRLPGSGRRRRPGRELRHHQQHDPRPHLQHGLRPGRDRRAAGQPQPLQPALSREAGLPPGGAGRVRFRGHPRRRAQPGRTRPHAHPLLQPPHRLRLGGAGPHRGRRAAHGAGGSCVHGGAEHADGRGGGRWRPGNELHRGPGQVRRLRAGQDRRSGHLPAAVRRWRRLQPGLGRGL